MLLAALMMTAMPMPDPSQDVKDARCVAAMLNFSSTADEAGKASINGVLLFFVGKLAGRHTPDQVRDILNGVEKDLAGADFKAIGSACTQEMIATGNVLQGK